MSRRIHEPIVKPTIHVTPGQVVPGENFWEKGVYEDCGYDRVEIERVILKACAIVFSKHTGWLNPEYVGEAAWNAGDGASEAFAEARYWLRCLNLHRPDEMTVAQWTAVIKPSAEAIAYQVANSVKYRLQEETKAEYVEGPEEPRLDDYIDQDHPDGHVIINPNTGEPVTKHAYHKNTVLYPTVTDDEGHLFEIEISAQNAEKNRERWAAGGFIAQLPSQAKAVRRLDLYTQLRQVGYTDADIAFMLEYQKDRGERGVDPRTPTERKRYERLLKKTSTLRHGKG